MYYCSECNTWLHHECVVDDIKKRYIAAYGGGSTIPTSQALGEDDIRLNIVEQGNSSASVISARNALDEAFVAGGISGPTNCTMDIECLCCRGTI